MKSTTSYQIKLAKDALKKSIPVSMTIRGTGSYKLAALRDVKHTLVLTIADPNGNPTGGFIAVDPDEIISVWVQELPPAFQESHLYAD